MVWDTLIASFIALIGQAGAGGGASERTRAAR
jgi:hypothetical protein